MKKLITILSLLFVLSCGPKIIPVAECDHSEDCPIEQYCEFDLKICELSRLCTQQNQCPSDFVCNAARMTCEKIAKK